MNIQSTRSVLASMRSDLSPEHRIQTAALCWKIKKGKPRILLITSRETRRWVIPKGWPIDGLKPHEAAAQEAWEEAGVTGKISDRCLGFFTYNKAERDGAMPCAVMVFPLKVRALSRKFPEARERTSKWFGRKKAAQAVNEPDLARILRKFDPSKLKR